MCCEYKSLWGVFFLNIISRFIFIIIFRRELLLAIEAFTLKRVIVALGIILTIINLKKKKVTGQKLEKHKVEILTLVSAACMIHARDFHNSSAIFSLWPCTP